MTLHRAWRAWYARTAAAMVAALLSASVLAQTAAPTSTHAQPKVSAPASDARCLKCHDDLIEESVVHPAMEKGCNACHGGIDASTRPHKLTGSIPHGLTAPPAELCVTCHEKRKLKKKVTHAALDKGCTECHEAHSSKHKKLLKTAVPELCHTCHDKKVFAGKITHVPARGGKCVICHDPHTSDHSGLLVKPPAELCLECHDDIKEAPHVVAGFSRSGHPLGDEKRPQPVEDPLRPGKPFYCGSCHAPHKSDFTKLLRIDPKLPEGFCQKCHQK